MAQPTYETLDDLPDHERDLQRYIHAITGGYRLTLGDLYKALERNGKDRALTFAALHLPEEEYNTFMERFKRHPVRHGMAGRKRRFS